MKILLFIICIPLLFSCSKEENWLDIDKPILIYPNPVQSTFRISFKNHEESTIVLKDGNLKIIDKEVNYSDEIILNIEDQKNGIYHLEIKQNKSVYIFNIVKYEK